MKEKFVVIVDERAMEQIMNQNLAEKWMPLKEFKEKLLPSRHTDLWGLMCLIEKMEKFFEVDL